MTAVSLWGISRTLIAKWGDTRDFYYFLLLNYLNVHLCIPHYNPRDLHLINANTRNIFTLLITSLSTQYYHMELWLYSCLNKHSRLWNFDNFVEYIFAGYSDHSLSINKKNPKSMLYAVITILFSLVSAWSICEVHSRWTLMRHSVWDGIITILLQFILLNEDDSRARWTFDIGLLCFTSN